MLTVMGSALMREFDAFTAFLPRATSTRLGVGRHLDRHDRRVFRAGIDRAARRSFHRYMRSARKEREMFDRIEAAVAGPLAGKPLLTIFGQWNDPLRFQPKWKQRYPSARQLVVARGMHFPMCDAPQAVAESITTWHRETPTRAA
jgi:haloalkane dehalogenase